MPVVEECVVVARPPQEVFDFLAKFENLSVYDAFVTKSGPVGTVPPGLGTRGWGTTRFMGREFDWMVEFTEFEPPRRMVSRSVGGERDLTATFMLEPNGGGTRVTERLVTGSMGGLLGKLPDPLVNRLLGRSLRRNLKTLTRVVEERPRPDGP
ncbi:SRPBCC family protein [Arthrobacter sp. B6]|uniref:SRPBCC family protein n=1 Tax=Arthrobacter sp. B6 TaxID=1570137 RepID=UPI000835B6BB|nr:SRPBCC family protein [Arthrobacter sp. B6]